MKIQEKLSSPINPQSSVSSCDGVLCVNAEPEVFAAERVPTALEAVAPVDTEDTFEGFVLARVEDLVEGLVTVAVDDGLVTGAADDGLVPLAGDDGLVTAGGDAGLVTVGADDGLLTGTPDDGLVTVAADDVLVPVTVDEGLARLAADDDLVPVETLGLPLTPVEGVLLVLREGLELVGVDFAVRLLDVVDD